MKYLAERGADNKIHLLQKKKEGKRKEV